MEVDETALIRDILEGNIEAFRFIVERHQTRIFYLGLKFLKGREEAEDFAQEVFLRAFERIDTYRGNGSFTGWLYRIAFNLAATTYRSGKRMVTESLDEERDSSQQENALSNGLPKSVPALPEAPHGPREVEQTVIRAEAVEEVNLALKRIPGRYAVLVKMHFYDGLTYPEISEILSMPINTIKSYIRRAKIAIRRLLTGHGYTEVQ